jgi:2-keto-4-pentenoate hydratase/2-oxohepta-3-ene-1,7-dioic acid hydratase in catechol pathway
MASRETCNVDGDAIRSPYVSVPAQPLVRIFEDDAQARMPASQLSRPIGVVAEQKVPNRVCFASPPPSQMLRGPAADPLGMRRSSRSPLIGSQYDDPPISTWVRGTLVRTYRTRGPLTRCRSGVVHAQREYVRIDALGNVVLVRIARFTTGTEPQFGVVETAAGQDVIAAVEGDPLYRQIQFSGERYGVADVRLLAPVIPRSKVVCVGRNYAEHAAELGNEVPKEPLLFFKPNTSVVGPEDGIIYPRQSHEVHYEAELAVVIGRLCKAVPAERVREVIFGYTCANDVTARDLQRTDGQWARAKGFDTFCPLGPWIETELDPSDLAVTCTVGGELRQAGRTKQMVFDVPTLVSYISEAFTLLPGDVILTGTPAGVGPMDVGDTVSVTIEGIGTLTNKVVATRG